MTALLFGWGRSKVRGKRRTMTQAQTKSPERAIRVGSDGDTRVMVGVTVCEGPKTYRLLLTHPHQAEGRIVDIPCDQIESIDEVEPSPRGARPSIARS